MQSTENVALDTRFFCLFKGDPGAGKTIAAGSYPGHESKPNIGPYFMDNDGRMKSLVKFWRPRGREFHSDRFDSFLVLNKQLEDFYNFGCPYRTIVYDGITTGSLQILGDMIKTRDPKAKTIKRAGIEMLQIEDYGGESRGLTVILDNLKAISFRWGINVIVTAHVLTTESTDLKSKVTTQSRSLLTAGKKVAALLPVHFDEAYHFDVQTGMGVDEAPKYTVITHNVGSDWAKTALPIPVRMDFTDKSLYDEIMKHIAASGDEYKMPEPDPDAPKVIVPESW